MPQITIEVLVHVPYEEAWEFFTEPKHIMRWNNASPDWHCPKAKNDLKVGGRFSSRMEFVDGKQGFDLKGIYTEIIPHHLIAYTMDDGRSVRVEFKAEDGGTRITETFDPEKENSLEMQKSGWQSILNNFKKYTDAP